MEGVQLARYYDPDADKIIVISIPDYNGFILSKDKNSIAKFVYGRLNGRYINPYIFSDEEYETKY